MQLVTVSSNNSIKDGMGRQGAVDKETQLRSITTFSNMVYITDFSSSHLNRFVLSTKTYAEKNTGLIRMAIQILILKLLKLALQVTVQLRA